MCQLWVIRADLAKPHPYPVYALRDLSQIIQSRDCGTGLEGFATEPTGKHRIFVVVEAHSAGLRHRGRQAMEAVEAAGVSSRVDRPARTSCGCGRAGTSIKQICRELRVSRKVVRKVLRSGQTEFRYERKHQPLKPEAV
jgi:hypothetical protein